MRRGLGKPETFTFLGFTFICSKTRRGKFQIKRKSRRDRMRVKLQAIKQELRRSMHQPQGRWLQQVVTGYFNYHAVPTNSSTLTAFLFHRQSAGHHLQAGAEWADTPRALAEKSDVIFTSLPEPADVERVALGADGLIEGVKQGAVYFDLSTNAQGVVKKIHEVFAAKGAQMLDAPVSGGPSGAASRKMAIWVGGDKAAFDRHKPVLDAMGDRAAYIEPIGTATVAKLVHNMSGYAITCALAETFTMGVKAGMDPVALWEAVRQGVGGRRLTFDGLLD
jgi:3-hydroxyisobutyrate dehydrogenase-like beta-hydroxyacid dehydrogenase